MLGSGSMYHGEKFNSISHLVGVVFAVAATSILVTMASMKGDPYRVVGFSIYGAMMIILYTASTLYHSFKDEKIKKIFMQLDHVSIYLMIAGTYTPITLVALRGVWGWTIFGVIWGLALFGVIQELWIGHKTRKVSLVTYILMGWLMLVAIKPSVEALPVPALLLILAGGLLYTGGFVFYLYDEKIKHGHGIWHLFVLAGSITHFASLVGYLS